MTETSVTDVVYRDIPDLLGYRVGSDGSVWSRWKRGNHGMGDVWRRLAANSKSGVYYMIFAGARATPSGNKEMRLVHRLVLESFVGPCPDGMQACHNNGDPKDNRAENLRWDTPSNNQADRHSHGTAAVGIRNPRAKLTEADIRNIRQSSLTAVELSRQYPCNASNISQIRRGITWQHVT